MIANSAKQEAKACLDDKSFGQLSEACTSQVIPSLLRHILSAAGSRFLSKRSIEPFSCQGKFKTVQTARLVAQQDTVWSFFIQEHHSALSITFISHLPTPPICMCFYLQDTNLLLLTHEWEIPLYLGAEGEVVLSFIYTFLLLCLCNKA